MSASQRPILKGIIAASPTPMTDDFSVDHGMLADHCMWLLANGCSSVALLGSTGEANSFSVMERLEILEKLVAAGIPPDRIMVGTGCCAFPDTVLLTKHALSLGVTTVLVLPPFYYKNVTEDGLFRAYETVLAKVDDDRLNMILYHNPKVSGVPIGAGLIERLIRAYPGSIAGMKDSGGDVNYMKANCERFPNIKIYSGSETYLLDILQSGGSGCISATLNVTCTKAATVLEKRESREAPVLQEKLAQIRCAFERYPLLAAVKCVLADIRNNKRWLNIRPPLSPPPQKDMEELARIVRAHSDDIITTAD